MVVCGSSLLSNLLKMATFASTKAGLYQLPMIYSTILLLFFSSLVTAHPYISPNSHPHRSAVAEDASVCRREPM